jgi:predicted phage baseplate assembly protein
VDVDQVIWHEAAGLGELGPRDRGYLAPTADDGTTTVQFGDGRLGARLPTGVENVRATYRVGIGAGGNLGAGQLTLLMTRPLGARGVTNPLPTTGGADPESRDSARENAPRAVLTFDRVVSLDDVANVARSFAGIGKSEARWVWEGRRRIVLVTVAGVGGMPVADVPTLRDLAAAIRDAGDPHQPIRFLSFAARTFDVDLGVFLAPDHHWDVVAAAVRATLLDAFSFDRRALAQPVAVSEVGPVVQAVEGVLAVDLDADGIQITGESPPAAPILSARPGRATPTGPMPAELLTVNPADGRIRIGQRG